MRIIEQIERRTDWKKKKLELHVGSVNYNNSYDRRNNTNEHNRILGNNRFINNNNNNQNDDNK